MTLLLIYLFILVGGGLSVMALRKYSTTQYINFTHTIYASQSTFHERKKMRSAVQRLLVQPLPFVKGEGNSQILSFYSLSGIQTYSMSQCAVSHTRDVCPFYLFNVSTSKPLMLLSFPAHVLMATSEHLTVDDTCSRSVPIQGIITLFSITENSEQRSSFKLLTDSDDRLY